MKSKKKQLIAGLAIAFAAAFVTWLALRPLHTAPEWPDFLTDKQDAPRYNYEVKERDFGYRTGNHVPVTLYFKLLPGMELATDQIVINGDFNVVSRKETKRQRVGENTLVRVDCVLQAFVLKPKLEAKPTVVYKTSATSDPKKFDMLTIEVYTSQTFDGRKSEHPKERSDIAEINDGHLNVTLGFIITGGLGLVLAVGMLVRAIKPRILSPKKPVVASGRFPSGWTAVQEAWVAITDGDHSKEAFTKVAHLIRSFFGVASLTVTEISRSSLPEKEPLAQFLTVCETALWTDRKLDDAELALAGDAFSAIETQLLEHGKPAAGA